MEMMEETANHGVQGAQTARGALAARRGGSQAAPAKPSVRTASGIAALVTPAVYRSKRENVYPSVGSLQWYMRVHRRRLVEAGALYLIAGKTLIEPRRFDRVVMEDGRAAVQSVDND